MHVRAVENPLAIRNRPENVAGRLDTFQYLAVEPATNALRGKQPSTLALAVGDVLPCLLEPVAA